MEGDKDVHRGHVFARAQGVPGGGDEHQGGVPRQPFLPDASIDFAGLTPSLTVDSALHRYDNL